MANLSLDWSRLKADVAYLVGWPGYASNATQESQIEQVVNDGYRVFLDAPYAQSRSHQWSFLTPRYEMELVAPYVTGTAGVAGGVVTLSGGTFPAWASQGRLSVTGGSYLVGSRDSDTQLTLEDTSIALAAGSSFSLERVTYDLPTNFAGFGSGPIVNESENFLGTRTIERVSESYIRRQRDYGTFTSYPRMAAHFFKEVDDTLASSEAYQQQVVEFYPSADRSYVVSFTYSVNPNQLSDSNTRPLGNQRYHTCLRAAVLAEAEQTIMDGVSQIWTAKFYSLLAQTVAYDKRASAPRTFGKVLDCSDQENRDYTDWERPIAPGDTYTYSG